VQVRDIKVYRTCTYSVAAIKKGGWGKMAASSKRYIIVFLRYTLLPMILIPFSNPFTDDTCFCFYDLLSPVMSVVVSVIIYYLLCGGLKARKVYGGLFFARLK
jgi:hypothetical protein